MFTISILLAVIITYYVSLNYSKLVGFLSGTLIGISLYFLLLDRGTNLKPGEILLKLIGDGFILIILNLICLFFTKQNSKKSDEKEQNLQEKKEIINFKGKKIELNPTKEVSFKDKKLSIKSSDLSYRKKKESTNYSNASIKKELGKVEDLYKQKLINASERKKMREKILDIE